MSCHDHVKSQAWCRPCQTLVEDVELPIVYARVDLSHQASAARIAGLEANVNEKLQIIAERDARIAALTDELAQLQSAEWRTIAEAREEQLMTRLRGLLDVLTRIGGHMTYEDQQTLRDSRAEVAG